MRETEKFVFFWETADIYSNWHPSKFEMQGNQFVNSEQAMMYEKAKLMGDLNIMEKVLQTKNPKEIKAFYMRLNEDGKTVAAMDVLFPGIGEIIGGSQREERLEVLKSKMNEMHVDEHELWWYLDTRKFGSVPHAGFGLGLERLILFVTGMTNIRDVIPFPRTPKNAEF